MSTLTKKQADAYDRMIDAAAEIADLLLMGGIDLNEYALEELTIFLASQADEVKAILKKAKKYIHKGKSEQV